MKRASVIPALCVAVLLVACDDTPAEPDNGVTSPPLTVFGLGRVDERYTSEVAVRGNVAYTATWSRRGNVQGNRLNVWSVTGGVPVLVDSSIIEGAGTLGDVAVSDDGTILVVASEIGAANGIAIFSLALPLSPQRILLYQSANTGGGVHTAKLARVSGRLYAFLSVNRSGSSASRLVILDLTDPSVPVEVLSRDMGNPFIHDVFVRDGVLFTALWNDGVSIWDIGGAGRGGTVAAPVLVSNVRTIGGKVHNMWWYRNSEGAKRYLFVGEEGPALLGTFSSGDIHVVDVADLAVPREVAFYTVPNAGTHNFAMDEARGILYAAYYNGGVRALDVRGDLSVCPDSARGIDTRCNLGLAGRERAAAVFPQQPVSIWGVAFAPPFLFASDMLNGLWKLAAFTD